ncbi:hypothetical protein BCR43DRAFT_236154 [Syncephalastrum racemosum]|uniref:Uncharacterized protein n=1 Tax=Syncephalastrum racemosum TaxID=13706 RepID=A0A1X2HEH3_SYNRA|nr:hypothetical protein BCR43DRAFT_236154 [Syncephalastrum racemosum]
MVPSNDRYVLRAMNIFDAVFECPAGEDFMEASIPKSVQNRRNNRGLWKTNRRTPSFFAWSCIMTVCSCLYLLYSDRRTYVNREWSSMTQFEFPTPSVGPTLKKKFSQYRAERRERK